MDERKPVKLVLFSSYTSATATLIQGLIERGVSIQKVFFTYQNKKRLSWKVRLRNLLTKGHFNEPKNILDKQKILFTFTKNHNSPEVQDQLKASGVDVLLLYGTKIISEDVLNIPTIGTLNAHSSLLPKYRGTKVEFWILYNNEPQYAGVTVHWVSPGLDEGDIFVQKPIFVDKYDTHVTLREKSTPVAAELFSEAIKSISEGNMVRIPQDDTIATKFKRPTKEQIREFYDRKKH